MKPQHPQNALQATIAAWLPTTASWTMGQFYCVIFSIPLLIGIALTMVSSIWHTAVTWCLHHRILLPAAAHPVVRFPGSQAGLDWPRLAIGVSLVLMAAAAAGQFLVTSILAARANRYDQEETTR